MKTRFYSLGTAFLAALTLFTATPRAAAQTVWTNALAFDGMNDYVQIADANLLDLTNNYTLECWFKAAGFGGLRGLVSKYQTPSANGCFLRLTTNNLDFDQKTTTNLNLQTGVWHHVAAVNSSSTRRLYLNGQERPLTGSAITVQANTNALCLGVDCSTRFFNGQMDEVRIWNMARSQAEIQANMNHPLAGTESNLVAYYRFDEGAGTVAYDTTTHHFDGTLVNGPAWTNSTLPPFINLNAGLPGVFVSSVAWGDYDNDGRLDILMAGLDVSENPIAQIWRNTGNGFTNINAGLPGPYRGSVAWGDYDNDGRLDILLTGLMGSDLAAQVWRNTGSSFTNVNAGLPGVYGSSVAWGDYDNDGRPDILLTGMSDSGLICQVWRNTGSGFTNINAGLPGVWDSSVAWGDYDSDERLDILLTGNTSSGYPNPASPIAQVWRNTGHGFTNINAGLPGVFVSSVAWGDYDNDARLDILLLGGTGANPVAGVWRNTANGFTNINAFPEGAGVVSGSVAWGDYDNDGLLDILAVGNVPYVGYGLIAQVWRNTGSGFTNIEAGLPGVSSSSVAWGDYDNDGRLDILLTGDTGAVDHPNPMAQVWRNNGLVANTLPSPSTHLAATVVGNGVTLSWNAASDAETPANGLAYNVRVGTSPGDSDVVSPQAASTGFRRLPALGNAQHRLTASLLADLPRGFYYWSVQAVDTAFAGSPFSAGPTGEATFVVAAETLPATYVSHTSETLQGLVHPFTFATAVWFEWGLTTNYGNTTTVANLASGTNTAVPVSVIISNLAFATYHYRVVATNDLGLHVGADRFFTVQAERPGVVTSAATDITSAGATLHGTGNPKWAETCAWFDYGLDARYGSRSSVTNLGNGPNALAFTISITSLLPWMTYHYRAAASNSVGRTDGPDATFTVPGPSMVAPSLSALPDVTLPQAGSTSVWFTVSAAGLDLQVRCNNPVLLPHGGLALGGSGTTRSLSLVPNPDHSGSAQVTVSASDGSRSASGTFTLTVTPPSGGGSSLLQLAHAEQVPPQTFRFQIVDAGTSSNYTVEHRPDLSPTNAWSNASNVLVTPLGGGLFRVDTVPPPGDAGFYRVKGFRLLLAGLDSVGLTVEEGAGTIGPVVVFNGLYTGTVSFTWSDEQGTTWTHQVQVNGTTAVLPIPASFLSDNAGIGQLKYLTLRLEAGTGFALGATTQSTVTIEENDAHWQGVVQTTSGTLDFGLTMLQTNGSLRGQIPSEGFGFFPTNALVQLNFTEDAFTAAATNIPLPTLTGYPLLSFTSYLDLRLDAANGPGVTNVSATQIQGVVTLVSRVPNRPHLDAAVSGTFMLLKSSTAPSTNAVPLYPAP